MRATGQDDEVEAIIARTALKYDLLPYQSRAFPQSHPSRIGAIARLFGLAAAPLETARVLELGCASGGNIIPHALACPNATFVGVDLARTQVAAGRARIARLGLTNIEIRCQSFTEIGDELGSFDYILCHGVYSWVPAAVQDAILRIIRARLSPVGVAYVSYNVLPGWRMLQPLRDAFLLQVADDVDSLGRVAKARELLGFLADATPDRGFYGDMLRNWSARLAGLPDDYVAHEFLEEMNQPSTVRDFAASAGRNGLGFLAECDIASMILENYGVEVARQVRARSNNDLVESEQYLDLLSGRTFRQTLLVSSERQATLNRVLEPASIAPFHFLMQSGTSVEQKEEQYVVTDTSGRSLSTRSPIVAEAIGRLVARFPSSSSLDDCVEGIIEDEGSAREMFTDALYRMLLIGMVTLSSEPVRAGRGGDRPEAIPLARADAAEGGQSTTNLRHETVTLDPATRVLLPAMDGSLDRPALARRLAAEALAGGIAFTRDGNAVSGAQAILEVAQEHLATLIEGMANAGLLQTCATID
jgi:methyltransferase-like protein/2-polyprenyl-3-methyl-5-hydroxy-6-metoxy-1,4-benzoquinol methylase